MIIETSWDDGGVADGYLIDLLVKYRIPATFYIPANSLMGGSCLCNLKNHPDLFRLGGHTINHPLLTRIPPEQARREIFETADWIRAKGFEPYSFCCPRGYANDEIRAWIKEAGFSENRTTLVGWTRLPIDPYQKHTTVHVCTTRKEQGYGDWFVYAKKILDSNPEYFHLWGHSWEIDRYNLWSDLESLLKYISEKYHESLHIKP